MRCRYRIRACEYLAAVNNAGITCRKAPVLPQGPHAIVENTLIIPSRRSEGQVEGELAGACVSLSASEAFRSTGLPAMNAAASIIMNGKSGQLYRETE